MGAIETLMEQVMEQGQDQTGQTKKVVRKYSAAFKASVVEECRCPGVSKAEIARKYGIHTSVMYRWVGQMRQTEPVREGVSTPEVLPAKASVPRSAQAVGPTPIQTTEQKTAPAGLPRGFIPIATAAPSSGAGNYSIGNGARMGPGYFPLILGVLLSLLGGISENGKNSTLSVRCGWYPAVEGWNKHAEVLGHVFGRYADCQALDDGLFQYLSPLGWEQIRLIGDCI